MVFAENSQNKQIFENWEEYLANMPWGRYFDDIALSYIVKEIQAILRFSQKF